MSLIFLRGGETRKKVSVRKGSLMIKNSFCVWASKTRGILRSELIFIMLDVGTIALCGQSSLIADLHRPTSPWKGCLKGRHLLLHILLDFIWQSSLCFLLPPSPCIRNMKHQLPEALQEPGWSSVPTTSYMLPSVPKPLYLAYLFQTYCIYNKVYLTSSSAQRIWGEGGRGGGFFPPQPFHILFFLFPSTFIFSKGLNNNTCSRRRVKRGGR